MQEISHSLSGAGGFAGSNDRIMKMNKLRPLPIGGIALLLACFFQTDSSRGDECPFPMFAATRAYPIGGVGFSLAVGDFNKDGKPDVGCG